MPEADRLRLSGRTQEDYDGYGYADLLADDLNAVAAVANDVAADSQAAIDAKNDAEAAAATAAADAIELVGAGFAADRAAAAASQTAAANSAISANTSATTANANRVLAENAVASVTVGSTNNLAYPEQIRNLITATDVVDVLVYDTRLDSDGGAWTERCTGASWYNETLNTTTRGAKRAFPKVALIVAQQQRITIYDALELDGTGTPRMWMVFDRISNDLSMLAIQTGTPLVAVAAMNGRIYRAVNNGTRSLVMIDFIDDLAIRMGSDPSSMRLGIAGRNAVTPGLWFTGGAYPTIGAATSLDTAVLPGAPTNALGVPIPTLLIGTTSGFNVLHPTGSNSARAAAVTFSGGIARGRFTRDGRIIVFGTSQSPPSSAEIGPIPYASTQTNAAWRTFRVGTSAIGATGGIFLSGMELSAGSLRDIADGALAQNNALNLIAEDTGNSPNSMVATVGQGFNTGWMPSTGIQLASLCDGVTGTISSAPIYSNNGSDITGFINPGGASAATLAVVSGELELTAASTGNAYQQFTITGLVAGETYLLTGTARRGTTSANATIAMVSVSPETIVARFDNTTTSNVNGRFFFVATASSMFLRLYQAGVTTVGATSYYDNISIVPAARDRSLRDNGLEVVGTLTRTVVATDSDLVAYSGFSATNYLTQPSNTSLAIGTGDVAVMGWVNVSSFASSFPIALAQGADAIELGVGTAGFRFRLQSSTAATDLTVTGTTAITGQWVFVVGLRRAGTMEIWVNGVREAALAAAAGTLTATPGALEVGRSASASSLAGLALFRVTTYAPTPSQIARMYRDERTLFQAGAKAFLGGTAGNTVRRISRSRYTNRLGVSLSDGLAIFDGLQRVERQTSATLSPAMASDNVTPLSMEAGLTLFGTASNIGVRRQAITGLDLMPINSASSQISRSFRALGITTDATPLVLSPRVLIGERELVVVRAIITARVYGTTDTESLTYERRATYFRDAGGNVTLRGSVQTIGTDVEVTSTADATLVIDTAAQTVAAQVTGIAATRLVWSARFQIERNTRENLYEELM